VQAAAVRVVKYKLTVLAADTDALVRGHREVAAGWLATMMGSPTTRPATVKVCAAV
jgi:hypothetical protein